MSNYLHAYADKRDGKYWAVTNTHVEGPFDTYKEAQRRLTPMFLAAQQDPEQRWRHGTASLEWHAERMRRLRAGLRA